MPRSQPAGSAASTTGHAARRLLLLMPFAPRGDAAVGGSRVMAQLAVRLAARHRVALLYLRAPDEPPLDPALRECCEITEEVPRSAESAAPRWLRQARLWSSLMGGKPAWVQEWTVPAYAGRLQALARAWQPEIIQVEFHIMAQYLAALEGYRAPRILTQHEPGAQAAEDRWRQGEAAGWLMPRLDAYAWRRYERAMLKRLDAVVVFTERDRQVMARLAQRPPIVTIPLGTTLPASPLNPLGGEPPNLLFVGNFIHAPNVDAAMRLVEGIFPALQARNPELRLCIVGDAPPQRLRKLANERVEVTGRVPDVTPYLDQATIVMVPLRLGGGMRVKVLEALAAGKPVIASRRAVEGLPLTGGQQALIADSDEEFREAALRLLGNADYRAALGREARAWACANLGWDASLAAYEALYETLLEGRDVNG